LPSWNLKVQYHVHKRPPLFPILSQMTQVHTFPTYFPKIHYNIILTSMPRSSNVVFSLQVVWEREKEERPFLIPETD